MRLHKAKVSPKSIIIDELPLTVEENPTIEYQGALTVIRVGIYCQHVELNGDAHLEHKPRIANNIRRWINKWRNTNDMA